MKIKVTDIDYCIEPEDVDSKFDRNDYNTDEEYEEVLKAEAMALQYSLPSEIILEVDNSFNTLSTDRKNDILCDMISDKTGFLIYTYNYEVIE